MRKKTLGRLLGAVLSLAMVITSVVPSYAAGIGTDVYFYAQNEETEGGGEETPILQKGQKRRSLKAQKIHRSLQPSL